MKWIKASEKMPPTGIKVIIKDKDGYVYQDIARIGWDNNITDYEWLDESAPDDKTVWVEVDVSKRLPNNEGKVLVVAKEWNRMDAENAVFIIGNKSFIYDDGEQRQDITQYVTHWLEKVHLPAPDDNVGGYSEIMDALKRIEGLILKRLSKPASPF